MFLALVAHHLPFALQNLDDQHCRNDRDVETAVVDWNLNRVCRNLNTLVADLSLTHMACHWGRSADACDQCLTRETGRQRIHSPIRIPAERNAFVVLAGPASVIDRGRGIGDWGFKCGCHCVSFQSSLGLD